MTKELGEPVVVSGKFALCYHGALVPKGAHSLKGVSGRHELFADVARRLSTRDGPREPDGDCDRCTVTTRTKGHSRAAAGKACVKRKRCLPHPLPPD